MDVVFGDEAGSSVADMERLGVINKRIGLDAFNTPSAHATGYSSTRAGEEEKAGSDGGSVTKRSVEHYDDEKFVGVNQV